MPSKIRSAPRTARPGWQRDPALSCPLDEAGEYTLRVKQCDQGEPHEQADQVDDVAYVLNVSLRRESPEGNINSAIGQSNNRLP